MAGTTTDRDKAVTQPLSLPGMVSFRQACLNRSNRQRRFRRFLTNPRPHPDARAAAAESRPAAGSLRGGQAAATVHTLIESARLAKLDVVTYLADVLTRVGSHPASQNDELLPQNRVASCTSATRRAELVRA